MSACSVALWRDGGVDAKNFVAMERGQSEALVPMIMEVLSKAGTGFPDLDLIAVTTGPGAFTGIRIGLAAARGMALAANLPCLGVTTLEVIAEGAGRHRTSASTVLVVLNAKRKDVYAQAFSAALEPAGPPRAVLAGDLAGMVAVPQGDGEPVVVVGDATGEAVAALDCSGVAAIPCDAPGISDAAVVAAIAARRWRAGMVPPVPSPLYLRPPDATLPRNGGRRRP
jgi:tRNA threonylcarbamoyladenosine biosynthesis protein TsaB